MSHHRKIVMISSAVLAALAAGAWRYDRAQGATSQTPPRHAVALLDFGRLLRESKRHREGLAAIRGDAVKADERLGRERQKLKAQRAEARRLPADSQERLNREAELDKAEIALGGTITLQTKNIRKLEAELYYRTYRDVVAETEAYAKANGIEVVLRLSSDPVDPGKLESVLGRFNRPVVWSATEADITAIVIERLNERTVADEHLSPAPGPA